MRQAIACVRNVLDRKGYNYRFDADKNKFTMGFNLNRTKLKSCDIVVYVRPISGEENYCRALLAYGNIAISADKSSMAQVCEYLTRANYGLTVGNFELDHRDGEIRYKVSINVRDDLPGDDDDRKYDGKKHREQRPYGALQNFIFHPPPPSPALFSPLP